MGATGAQGQAHLRARGRALEAGAIHRRLGRQLVDSRESDDVSTLQLLGGPGEVLGSRTFGASTRPDCAHEMRTPHPTPSSVTSTVPRSTPRNVAVCCNPCWIAASIAPAGRESIRRRDREERLEPQTLRQRESFPAAFCAVKRSVQSHQRSMTSWTLTVPGAGRARLVNTLTRDRAPLRAARFSTDTTDTSTMSGDGSR